MDILTLFCKIDDFFLDYERWIAPQCLPEAPPIETRGRPRQLHPSEGMTLLIAFHQSGYRTFKHFYLKQVCVYWRAAFPHLVLSLTVALTCFFFLVFFKKGLLPALLVLFLPLLPIIIIVVVVIGKAIYGLHGILGVITLIIFVSIAATPFVFAIGIL